MLNNIFISKGVRLAFFTALVSGLAVFFNKFAVTGNIDPYQFTALKNILVALVLSLVMLMPLVFRKIKDISRKNWIRLISIGVVGGSIPFLLFFKGLSMTSAVSAGFIHKTLFIWVAIMAAVFLKEKISKLQYIALAVLLFGNILLSGFATFRFGLAEAMVLLATLLWSVENIIAKKVLTDIDPKVVAWSRMFFGSIILLVFVLATSGFGGLFSISTSQWGWIILSVGFLTAYVVSWYHALKHEKASVVASVLVIASPITTLLNAIYQESGFDINKILGILVSILAVILFIYFGKRFEYLTVKKDAKAI